LLCFKLSIAVLKTASSSAEKEIKLFKLRWVMRQRLVRSPVATSSICGK
jgi:hypothetical protein